MLQEFVATKTATYNMTTPVLTTDNKCNYKQSRFIAVTGFVIFTVFYFISYFHRIGIPGTIFNQLQKDFSATAMQISMLGAGFLYVYAVMQLFVGILVDKWGTSKMILIGAAAMTIGAFGFAWVHNYPLLLSFRILVAFGASLIYLSLVREISDVFSEKNFAIFLSISLIIGYSGGLAGTYPFERASAIWGWRHVMLAVAIFSLLMLILSVIFFGRKKASKVTVTKISISDISKIVSNILTFPIYITNCISFSVFFLIQSTIGKKMLEDCFGFSSDTAASYTFILVLASVIGSGLSGFVSRMINNRRKPLMTIGASLTLSFSILLIMAINDVIGQYILLPAYIILGLSNIGLPMAIANTRELNFPQLTATAIGFFNTGCYAMVAILVTVAGSMLDLFKDYTIVTESSVAYPKNAYLSVLMMCMVLSVFSVFGSCIIKETRGINISPVEN